MLIPFFTSLTIFVANHRTRIRESWNDVFGNKQIDKLVDFKIIEERFEINSGVNSFHVHNSVFEDIKNANHGGAVFFSCLHRLLQF